jgi:shikimate kinase
VIVGLMGSGKTTIGRSVAARLGRPLRDSDADIEATSGMTVRELGRAVGVDQMHELEAAHLLDCIAADEPSVIGAAASTIEAAQCRAALESADVLVVWLRAATPTLASRFGAGAHRPAFGSDVAAFLADQARRREPLFAGLRPLIVDTGALTAEQATDYIVGAARAARAARRGHGVRAS